MTGNAVRAFTCNINSRALFFLGAKGAGSVVLMLVDRTARPHP